MLHNPQAPRLVSDLILDSREVTHRFTTDDGAWIAIHQRISDVPAVLVADQVPGRGEDWRPVVDIM
jgi:hypothetical protein